MAISGSAIILFFIVLAIIAPFLTHYSPTATNLALRLLPPSPQHWLGTDDVGMDVFTRIAYGARVDLESSLIVVLSGGTIGTLLGLTAGWLGGWWDEILMRITDMFLAFPSLILAMAISAVLTPNLTNALIAISVTYWPIYARLARAQVLAVRKLEYIEAARSVGMSQPRILFRHILPNTFTPLLVEGTLDMGSVLLIAAGLSFIGFGAQPPTPEWGLMIAQGQNYLMTQWWVSTAPAIAILLLVIGFNQLGDALRDILDPRLRWKR
jgi:peptide/nickel transport system permease protein